MSKKISKSHSPEQNDQVLELLPLKRTALGALSCCVGAATVSLRRRRESWTEDKPELIATNGSFPLVFVGGGTLPRMCECVVE